MSFHRLWGAGARGRGEGNRVEESRPFPQALVFGGLKHASPPRAGALGPGTVDAPPGGRARVSRGLSGEWSRRRVG